MAIFSGASNARRSISCRHRALTTPNRSNGASCSRAVDVRIHLLPRIKPLDVALRLLPSPYWAPRNLSKPEIPGYRMSRYGSICDSVGREHIARALSLPRGPCAVRTQSPAADLRWRCDMENRTRSLRHNVTLCSTPSRAGRTTCGNREERASCGYVQQARLMRAGQNRLDNLIGPCRHDPALDLERAQQMERPGRPP